MSGITKKRTTPDRFLCILRGCPPSGYSVASPSFWSFRPHPEPHPANAVAIAMTLGDEPLRQLRRSLAVKRPNL